MRNIPLARPSTDGSEERAVLEVLRSGLWTTGPTVTAFEDACCDYLGGSRHAVALNSCTAGLFLALKALGVGPGDEVIVPTWTFAASALVVEWLGATPVLCDVSPATLAVDPEAVARLVTPRTRAAVPVHLFGYPCDMDALQEVADSRGMVLVEDAAHAFGTRYGGRKIGSFGRVAVFSFYATKNLACGEGGMVVSGDEELVERVRRLSYFGIDKKAYERTPGRGPWFYDIAETGYKCNMDSLHAAIGLAQLRRLDAMNDKRLKLAEQYDAGLDPALRLDFDPRHHHTRHLYPILLPPGRDRDDFMNRMRDRGVGCGVHYVPLHRHSHYAGRFPAHDFPVAESLADRLVTLPMHPDMTEDDVAYVLEHARNIPGGLRN